MTTDDLLEYASLAADAVPGATQVVRNLQTGAEAIGLAGHTPVLWTPDDPTQSAKLRHPSHERWGAR